jgi:hypothetical protein
MIGLDKIRFGNYTIDSGLRGIVDTGTSAIGINTLVYIFRKHLVKIYNKNYSWTISCC